MLLHLDQSFDASAAATLMEDTLFQVCALLDMVHPHRFAIQWSTDIFPGPCTTRYNSTAAHTPCVG